MKLIKLTSPLPCVYFQSFVSAIKAYQLLHAFQILFKENNFVASEVVKRSVMSHEHKWNLS
jgi:hypothetical protein